MRSKRFRKFESLTESQPRPFRIIDVGGTISFWENRGWADREDVYITLVNLDKSDSPYGNIDSRIGDATNLEEFENGSFDVAFSNSVIEHLYTFENQVAMAKEVQRVARAYFIQTPNYWFPIEPHFQVAGWQWLPESVRVRILQHRRCGRRGPFPDIDEALESIREVRLMTRSELARIFPNATIWPERILGLVKSWTAFGGFREL